MADTSEDSIPIVAERAHVETRRVESGRVRVRTETETEEVLVPAELSGEAVEVERVPVDREIDAVPQVRNEDGVTVIPVVEEVLVVEKRLVLREEIHVRRRATEEQVEVPVTLRRQRAVIDRSDEGPETDPIETER